MDKLTKDPFGDPEDEQNQPAVDPFGDPEEEIQVEPEEGAGIRIRGDIADIQNNPAGFLGYEISKAADEALPGLKESITQAAFPLSVFGGDAGDLAGHIIPGLREEVGDMESQAIKETPAIQAAGVVLPPLIGFQQGSESLRASAFFGISDTIDKLKNVDTFLNLFTEEGREKNKRDFLDISNRTYQDAMDSLTGKIKKQFGTELEKRGVPRTLSPLLGLGLEVATDPLTYITGGSAKAAAKAAEAKLAPEAEHIIPEKEVLEDLEFVIRPNKQAADYAKEITKTQDALLKLQKNKSFLSNVPEFYAKVEKELRAKLKRLRIDAVYADSVDFANNTYKRTIRALSLISSYLEGRGKFGAALARQVEKADQTMQIMRARWLSKFDPEGNLGKIFDAMTRDEKLNFVASLEGFEKPSSQLVKRAYDIADEVRKEIADEATKRGVMVKTKTKGVENGERAFVARGDYFPHYILNPKRLFINPEGLQEALEYTVRTGKFKDMDEAVAVFEHYSNAVKSFVPSDMVGETLSSFSVQANAKNKKFFDWIVKSGQAKDINQAVSKFNNHMNKISVPMNQSLEMERILNIPFHDVDPTRTFARYFSGAAKRFGEIDHLGISSEPEIVNSLIHSMEKDMYERGIENYADDISAVKDMMSLIVGSKAPKQVFLKGISNFVRNMEAASSLTYAFVMNATQLINTASVVGMKNTLNAFVDAMEKEGKEYAFKSGSVFNEFTQSMFGIGADSISGKLAKLVMENLTPFQVVERNNRVVTAIAAKNFIEEQAAKLVAGEGKTFGAIRAAKNIRKAGLSPEKILANKGKVELEDFYRASQNIGTRTQFRARVQDAPEWASSEFGRIANQFKNFIEQQWKFMRNEIYREAKDGNYAPLMRYAVLSPSAGLIVKEIKAKLTGRNSKLNNDSDLMNLASAVGDVGSYSMMYDIYRNLNYNGAGWVSSLVPAINDFGKISYAGLQSLKPVVNRLMNEPEARILDLKPVLKAVIPKVPLVSFYRTQLTDMLIDDEDKSRLATEYIRKAKLNGLSQDEINTVKQGLKERYKMSSFDILKSQVAAYKSINDKKAKVREQRIKFRSNPLGYWGL